MEKQKRYKIKSHDKIMVAIIITLIFIIIALIINPVEKTKTIYEIDKYWFMSECNCSEWNGQTICDTDYTLRNKMCYNIYGGVMNSKKECSKYLCPNMTIIVGFNGVT